MIISQPHWPIIAGWLARSQGKVIFDLYTPESLETIEHTRTLPRRRRQLAVDVTLDRLISSLDIGDHFMCANERQRDLWIGAILASNNLSIASYDQDPTLRNLIDVVPYGLPSTQPTIPPGVANPITETFPGIASDDDIVLWNGGIWPWLDAESAITAFSELVPTRPRARLVFMGASSNPVAESATAAARELASKMGMLGTHVLFNERWVPYGDRFRWLAAANCSLSLHHEHLETRYSSRTRLLDCFWAGLPIVCSDGDEFADEVRRHDLGAVTAGSSPSDVAAALDQVLRRGRGQFSANLQAMASSRTWDNVAGPLMRWIFEQPTSPRNRYRKGSRRFRQFGYRVGHRMLDRRTPGATGL